MSKACCINTITIINVKMDLLKSLKALKEKKNQHLFFSTPKKAPTKKRTLPVNPIWPELKNMCFFLFINLSNIRDNFRISNTKNKN